MKIGFFSDPHCGNAKVNCKVRHPYLGIERMKKVLSGFGADGVELVVCCGDIIDGTDGAEDGKRYLRMASEVMRECGIPFVCIPGNHDLYEFDHEMYYRESGFGIAPLAFEADGVTLVFLDACYTDDGKPYFSEGTAADWKNSFIPDKYLSEFSELLKNTGDSARFWIVTHQCLDTGIDRGHVIRNAESLRALILEYGRGRVEKCICGHYHKGGRSSSGGIEYITIHALCTDDEIQPGSVIILDTDGAE